MKASKAGVDVTSEAFERGVGRAEAEGCGVAMKLVEARHRAVAAGGQTADFGVDQGAAEARDDLRVAIDGGRDVAKGEIGAEEVEGH